MAEDIHSDYEQLEATLVWNKNNTCHITVKDAFEIYRDRNQVTNWMTKHWQKYLPPKILVFAWKIQKNILPTKINANYRGVLVYGGSCVCDDKLILEDKNHF